MANRFPASATLLVAAVAAWYPCSQAFAQPALQPGTLGTSKNTSTTPKPATKRPTALYKQEPPPLFTFHEHWKLFLNETFSPLSAAATIFNSSFSQLTNSDPRYGRNGAAFAQRIGATAADIASQNFFGDLLIASALREDPRYFRRGEEYGFWYRFSYAISRAVVIRTASGGSSFNWDNVVGCAMTVGLTNAYYPPPSRTGGAMLINFATSIADAGFVNLAPEFWPDFRRKFFRRHRPRSRKDQTATSMR